MESGARMRWPVPAQFDPIARIVTLFDIAPLSWREPFFHETIARARREHPNAAEIHLDFDRFISSAEHGGIDPAGFIYHAGRCGSTLLANMLAASGDHLILKEPDPVSDLMAHRLGDENPKTAHESDLLIAAAIRYLVQSEGTARYRLVKFAAWNIRCAATLSERFVNTPCVFVFRDPAETVASMLAHPPSWSDLASCPRALQARFFPSIGAVGTESSVAPLVVFAHAWSSAVEAALMLPPDTLLLLDYAELVRDPRGALLRVLAHLRQPVDPARLASMVDAAAIYSKDPAGHIAFDPGGLHCRAPLSPLQQAVVADITGDAWSQLSRRHQGIVSTQQAQSDGA